MIIALVVAENIVIDADHSHVPALIANGVRYAGMREIIGGGIIATGITMIHRRARERP